MLHLDLYKQPFRLLLPDRKNEYRTFTGAALTILTIIVLLAYGGVKLSALIARDDYRVQNRELMDFYEDIDPLSSDDGFVIAAAITGFEGPLVDIPPEYGSLRFYRKEWSQDVWLNITEIETLPCS